MKKRQLMILYTVLLCLSVIFVQYKSIVILLVIMLNAIAMLTDRKLSGIVLMSSFILPGEIFPIINVCMTILLNAKKIQYRKPSRKYMIFFAFVFVVSIINAIKYDTYINVIIYTLYIVFIYAFLCYSAAKIDINDLLYGIKGFIFIELIADVIIAIKAQTFSPGDLFVGTMTNAHWMGNWAVVCFIALLFVQNKLQGMKLAYVIYKNFVNIICVLVIMWLADCKLLTIAMIAGIVLYYVFENVFKLRKSFFAFFILLSLMIFILSYTINFNFVRNAVNFICRSYSAYIYNTQYDFNGKAVYIMSTFTKQLDGIHFFTGYGLGQYGSRVANLFAYTEMWRNNNFINNFIANNFSPLFIPEYAQYIKYYTADFVKNIGGRSAILSYPFNSFTAVFAELGVIGSVIFARLIEEYTKDSVCKSIAFYFLLACVFDIYFDNFVCIGFVIFIIVNTQVKIDNKC